MASSNPKLTALWAILGRVIEKIPSESSPVLGHYHAVWGPAGDVVEAAAALHKLHAARNPNDTDATHFKRVSSAAAKVLHQIGIADSRAKVAKQAALADIDRRRNLTLNLKANSYAAEVRAAFRQMSQQDRTKYLSTLIDSVENGPELAALLCAPPITTGITEVMREQFEKAYADKHAAQEMAQERFIEDTFSHSVVVLETARELVSEYTDAQKLADITQREQEAAAAAQNFQAKVQA